MIEIKPDHPIFFGINWTIIAAKKGDDARKELQHILAVRGTDQTEFICTDGARMHKFTTENEKVDMVESVGEHAEMDGLYRIVAVTKKSIVLTINRDETIEFPDYKKVIPDVDNGQYQEIDITMSSDDIRLSQAFSKLVKVLNGALSFKLFTESLRSDTWITYVPLDPHRSLVFKNPTRYCIIMPLRSQE